MRSSKSWGEPVERPAVVMSYGELSQQIIGVFYEVYNELGFGFVEVVYQRAMRKALGQAGFLVGSEVAIPVCFREEVIGVFKADLVVENRIVVELKVAEAISKAHEAQLTHYLRASQYEVGLVLCFGDAPRFRRVEFLNSRKRLGARGMLQSVE